MPNAHGLSETRRVMRRVEIARREKFSGPIGGSVPRCTPFQIVVVVAIVVVVVQFCVIVCGEVDCLLLGNIGRLLEQVAIKHVEFCVERRQGRTAQRDSRHRRMNYSAYLYALFRQLWEQQFVSYINPRQPDCAPIARANMGTEKTLRENSSTPYPSLGPTWITRKSNLTDGRHAGVFVKNPLRGGFFADFKPSW